MQDVCTELRGLLKPAPSHAGASLSQPSSPTIRSRPKIVFMGGPKVGKSALLSRFMNGSFPYQYIETIEEMHRGHCRLLGRRVSVDILDTSGSIAFPAMRKLNINQGEAFVLVYSVDDAASFEEVRKLRQEILEAKAAEAAEGAGKSSSTHAQSSSTHAPGHASRPPVIVVVGNKTDIPEREITREIAESIVCLDWENGYIETSAMDDDNVEQIFKEVLKQANLSPKSEKEMNEEARPRASTFSAHSPKRRLSIKAAAKRTFSFKAKSKKPTVERRGSCTIS